MTDRWCHNDFQSSGAGSARACLGSPHSGLTVANTGIFFLEAQNAYFNLQRTNCQFFFLLLVREGSGKLCLNCSIFRQYYLHGCHFDLLWGHSQAFFLFPFLLTALSSSLNCHNLLFCFSVLCLCSWGTLWQVCWLLHVHRNTHTLFFFLPPVSLFFSASLLCVCGCLCRSWPEVKAAGCESQFKHNTL